MLRQNTVDQERAVTFALYVPSPGDYAGFDERELTSESGGKAKVIQHLKDRYGYQNVVHIGDGATDLEACPPAVSGNGDGSSLIVCFHAISAEI